MATRYLKSSTKTANLSDDFSRWELSAGRTIRNNSIVADSAITIRDIADYLSLSIKGKVLVTDNTQGAAIRVLGDNARIGVAKGALIDSVGNGIVAGYNADEVPFGLTKASVSISGTVTAGRFGIVSEAGLTAIAIGATGKLIATQQAIYVPDGNFGDQLSIVNSGRIESKSSYAIYSDEAAINFVNNATGFIFGDISGSNLGDRFDLRSPVANINGIIDGRSGDDIYTIYDAAMLAKIEDGGGLNDTLRTTVSVDLSTKGQIENVTVLGKTAIDVIGNNARNVMTGNAAANKLDGLGEADVLSGYGGDDLLDGGDGNDKLFGGTGKDTLNGGDGNDDLRGEDGDDVLDGGNDDDTLDGSIGIDTLYGGAGQDTLNGASDDDELNGGNDFDKVDGGTGKDKIHSSAGADELSGSKDTEMDTFIFHAGFNGTKIMDFENDIDKIDLSDLDFGAAEVNAANSFAQLTLADEVVLGVVVGCKITVNGETVRLLGIDKAVLDINDFIF